MKRLWRIIRLLVAGAAALILLAVAAVVIVTRTARFNDFVRVRLVDYLFKTYSGDITIGRIEGSVWGSLTLRDINLGHNGTQVAFIPQLRVGYSLLDALHGRIVLSDLGVIKPEISLARERDGRWNLLAAITERHPSPPSASGIAIALRQIVVENAKVSVATAPKVIYRADNLNVSAGGMLNPSAQSFNVGKLDASISGPKLPRIRVHGALEYDEARQVATIKVANLSLATDRSQVDLNGTLRDLSAKNVTATINLRKLAAADINSFVPAVALARDLSGNARLSGDASDLHATMALAAGDARIDATVRANIAKSDPVWRVDAKLAKLDLRQLLKQSNANKLPRGRIDASIRANATGVSLAAVTGQVDARVAGLSNNEVRLGDLSLTAALSRQVANLTTTLNGPNARARLTGRIDIAKVPAYNLTLGVDHFHPAGLLPKAQLPPADLNLTAAIEGTGYNPDTMRTRTRIKWLPSTYAGARIDSGRIDAQVAAGTLQISALSVQSGASTATADGRIALNAQRTLHLNYHVIVGQASPWLALARRQGNGRMNLAGQVDGKLKQLHTVGSADFSALRFDANSVGHARLTYDLAAFGTPAKLDGQLMLIATELHAGVELKSLQTSVRFVSGPVQKAIVNINAADRSSHPAGLRADIAYKPGQMAVNLTDMEIATATGTWRLSQPAQFTQKGPQIEIHRFLAANHDQTVTLDGTVSQAGTQDLTARIQRLRLADLSSYVPQPVELAGLASAELTVRGSAAAPLIVLHADVAGLKVAKVAYSGLSARLNYANGRAQADTVLSQDASHSLKATAVLPIRLAWAHGFEAAPTGDVDLRASSSGLDLAFLNLFGNRQVTGIGGSLSLDVSARGPLRHPLPGGYIRLSGAHARVRELGVELTQATAEIQLDQHRIRLVTLSAKAGDGTLTGGGALDLRPDGTPDQVNLTVAIDNWPAIATHESNATAAGRVNVAGRLNALQVDGRIEVLSGVFRPVPSLIDRPHPDETVVVVSRWGAIPRQPPKPRVNVPNPNTPQMENVALHLEIVIHRNTWIKSADFAVELEGGVHVRKARGQATIVSGAINTVRGTLVVAQREFKLVQGDIMFTGGTEIDPSLHIVAQERVQTYLLSATVSGTATKPALTLSSIPDMPQADILSMMMFGKPASQLSGGQQKGLENEAMSMAGGYAASQVGASVANALGLGKLGVEVSGAGGVGFGRYVGDKIYVSASQSTSSMQNRQAEANYYVTPNISVTTSASTNMGNEIRLDWHKEY